jgi:hypothetical protein
MRVKVGGLIYDGEIEPVMAVLSKMDKTNIAAMADDATCYCSFPAGMSTETMKAWMAGPSRVSGVCGICGCRENSACVDEVSGERCSWADATRTLCSFCDDPVAQI